MAFATETQEEKVLPVWKRSYPSRGSKIDVAIFEFPGESNGRKFVNHSITFQRQYYDKKKEEWATATGFQEVDLPLLAAAALQAHEARYLPTSFLKYALNIVFVRCECSLDQSILISRYCSTNPIRFDHGYGSVIAGNQREVMLVEAGKQFDLIKLS